MPDDEGFYSKLGDIFEDERYSDFTIRCGSEEFKVHRIILSSNSGFFDRLCSGSFKEAKEGTVSLSEDDPVEVGLMLEFFYYKGYADHMEWRVKHQDRLQNMLELHTRMCILGDKYGCSDLVIFADSAFRDTFDARKRGTRMDVQSLAHDVFELITRFYAYMPDPLRETCINLFRARKEDKERMHDLPLLQAPLLDLMREQPTFAADLVKKLGLRFT